MNKVNKVDFYCGAFLSYLITNKVEPTLFDATDKSKVVRFSLKTTDYNIYVKYNSSPKKSIINDKEYTKWDFIFTEKEKDFLLDNFAVDNRENLVVLVCTNEKLKDTCFAVLTFEQALSCLGDDKVNKQWRITVKHKKKSEHLYCHGTALSDNNAIQVYNDSDYYFGFSQRAVITI